MPDSGIARAPLPELELTVSVPLADPAAAGVKTVLKVALPPAFRVSGNVGPVKVKPLPVMVALEIVTASPPEFVTDTGTPPLEPTVIFPKVTLAGFAVSAPDCRPVPDREMLSGESEASDVTVNVPLDELPATGLKVTLKARVWFGSSVAGRVKPVVEKPGPLMLICEIVTVAPPVLVKASDRVELWPN